MRKCENEKMRNGEGFEGNCKGVLSENLGETRKISKIGLWYS